MKWIRIFGAKTCFALCILSAAVAGFLISYLDSRELRTTVARVEAGSVERTFHELFADDAALRGRAHRDLLAALDDAEQQLITRLETSGLRREKNDPRELASQLLGRSRSKRAMSALIRNIELFQTEVTRGDLSPFPGHPCAEALTAIGSSAVDAIFLYVAQQSEQSVSHEAVELYAQVIFEVYISTRGSAGAAIEDADTAIDRFISRQPEYYRSRVQRVRDEFGKVTSRYR